MKTGPVTAARIAYAALDHQLKRMLSHEPGVREGSNPEEFHDMRVAIRRLRAALRVFRDAIPRREAERLSAQLRTLAEPLGRVRDLDVCLDQLDKDLATLAKHKSPVLLEYRAAMGQLRERMHARMLRFLDGSRYAPLVRRLKKFVAEAKAGPNGAQPAEKCCGDLIQRRFRRLLRASRDALSAPEDAALHRLRIRLKRLRYTCQFCEELHGSSLVRFIRRLARMQDLLGKQHDAVVARQRLLDFKKEDAGVKKLLALQSRRVARRRQAFLHQWPEFAVRNTPQSLKRALGNG